MNELYVKKDNNKDCYIVVAEKKKEQIYFLRQVLTNKVFKITLDELNNEFKLNEEDEEPNNILECPSCNGTGIIRSQYSDTICVKCNGTGQIGIKLLTKSEFILELNNILNEIDKSSVMSKKNLQLLINIVNSGIMYLSLGNIFKILQSLSMDIMLSYSSDFGMLFDLKPSIYLDEDPEEVDSVVSTFGSSTTAYNNDDSFVQILWINIRNTLILDYQL